MIGILMSAMWLVVMTSSACAREQPTVTELLEASTEQIKVGAWGEACITMRRAFDEAVRQDLDVGFLDRQMGRTIDVCGKAWR